MFASDRECLPCIYHLATAKSIADMLQAEKDALREAFKFVYPYD